MLADAREALEAGEYAASAAAFIQLLGAPGYDAEANYGLGWIDIQRGASESAELRLRQALASDPGHANAWFALGRITEERSVDDAVACYRRSLAANGDHHGARERLRMLGESETQPPTDAAPAPAGLPDTRPADAPMVDVGGLGVVDYLMRDQSEVARDALARIERLDRSGHFRVTAHLQAILLRLVGLLTGAVILGNVLYDVTPLRLAGGTVHFYAGARTEVILAAAGIWALWTVWTVLDCVTNTITIRNARIRWTRGVLNKRTETLDVWTARDVELDRCLVQRMTGDGTLTFKGTTHDRPRRFHKGKFKPLRLTGVARADELETIYALLLDLKFLLRAHPGLKGIIQ